MKIADNSIKSVKAFFHSELGTFYDENEINNFISWLFYYHKKWSKSQILFNLNERLSESELLIFIKAIKRLKNNEPIQYIVGETEFADCRILVNPSVLIPRPETEELVYEIKKRLGNNVGVKIIDLCTGSGCIALGLKKQIEDSEVDGLDLSKEAIETAQKNAQLNELKVNFKVEDVLKYIPKEGESYQVIVSNPPYVLEKEKALMQENVINHEPHLALFVSDDDPLLFYRTILKNWEKSLVKGGFFAFEINEAYGTEMVNLFDSRYFEVELIKDMQEKPRMLFAKKQ